jgi:hypothetical protein
VRSTVSPCLTRERTVLLSIWGVAVFGCALGLASHPPSGAHGGVAPQALDLVRLLSTAALVVVLVLGPGLALRAGHPQRQLSLRFVPIPGLAALAVCACLAWALSRAVDPRIVGVVALAPLLGWIGLRILRGGAAEITTSEERWALMVVAAVLGIAVARSLWSLGPPGELLAGTTFRTLEVGTAAIAGSRSASCSSSLTLTPRSGGLRARTSRATPSRIAGRWRVSQARRSYS